MFLYENTRTIFNLFDLRNRILLVRSIIWSVLQIRRNIRNLNVTMNHKITFAKVAAMQYVTTPEGEKLCAIYINKNRIDFNPLHKVKDISNTLPDEVKRAVCKRFFFVFSLPVEERGIIASLPDISI